MPTVMLRVNVASEDAVKELVAAWIHGDGEIAIVTDDVDIPARLTYVKERD